MTKRAFLLSTLALLSASGLDAGIKIPVARHQKPVQQQEHVRHDRIIAKHREGNGIGYRTGYSTVEGFFSHTKNTHFAPFLDARVHVFNDSKKAYNLGAGFRTLSQSLGTVFGLNVFYDYRDGSHRAFNQIGVGFEVLGQQWDLRGNGYIPVHHTKKTYQDGFLKFKESSAVFAKRYEFAFIGCDLALGRELFKTKYWDMHFKLEGYWFNGDYGKNAGGGLFELSTNITRYLTLKGQVSYDTLFREIFQGEAAINIPFGPKFIDQKTCLSAVALKDLENRLVESVDRFEIIVTSTKRKKTVAIDPLTGQPLRFIFVDNTSHSLGTFESPFPTLQQAQAASTPNSVIYVFPGDGTSRGMNSGITLLNNQKLIGSSTSLSVTTPFGVRVIPAQTLTVPSITNSSGNVVTLANNNAVKGLTITSVTGFAGVFGTSIAGVSIANSSFIQSDSETSINLQTITGNTTIHDNTFQGIGSGLVIIAGQNATGDVRRNFFACAAETGAPSFNTTLLFRNASVSGGTQVFTFDSNVFIPPATGGPAGGFTSMFVSTNTVTAPTNFTFNITNNTILNTNNNPNLGGGIEIDGLALNSNININISDNTVINRLDSTVAFSGIVTPTTLSTMQLEMDNNNVFSTGSGSNGFLIGNAGSSFPLTVRMVGNISTATAGAIGYEFNATLLKVQSPNGQLSGFEALNVGTVTIIGSDITFIPFTAAPLF